MLTAVSESSLIPIVSNPDESTTRFQNLELRYDQANGVLWKFIASDSTPYFSHDQLSDIRAVQSAITNGSRLELPNYDFEGLKFVVFASKIPKVFSLGGDLELTRFRGYLTLLEGGCHDAQNTNCLSTGLPATDDRTGTGGPQPGRPGTRV